MQPSETTSLSCRRGFIVTAAAATTVLVVPNFRPPLPSSLSPVLKKKVPQVRPRWTPEIDKPRLLPRALAALEMHAGRIADKDIIGIVDFAEPSRAPRFHLVDTEGGHVTTHLVAHGSGSDPDRSGWVKRFSNQPDSNASSRGAYVTGPIYDGKHGRSRRLTGLDGENSMAMSRGIVIHAAGYVDGAIASLQGRIGRSQGCFAVAEEAIDGVLRMLGPGRLLFACK